MFKSFINKTLSVLLFTLLAAFSGYANNIAGDSGLIVLNRNIQSVLSVSPEDYSRDNINQLIELTQSLNHLKLPTISIILLTDKRFKPIDDNISPEQRTAVNKTLARAYMQTKNYNEAEKFYKKVIGYYSDKNNKDSLLTTSFELTDMFIEEQKTDKALLYLLLIHKITDLKPDSKNRCKLLLREAKIATLNQHFNKAIGLHLKALDSLKGCGSLLTLQHQLELVSLYTLVHNTGQADMILKTVGGDSVLSLSDYYLSKSALFREKKDFKRASRYFKLFMDETNRQNEATDHSRKKMLAEDANFMALIASVKPVQKEGFFSWGISLLGIALSLIILTILILIIISQRKQLQKRKQELLNIKNTRLKLLDEGKALAVKEEDGIQSRLELIKKELVEKKQSIDNLKQQIENSRSLKKKLDKVNLEINFEVRSLLSSIIGLSGIFKTEFARLKNKELYKYADIIDENASLLLNIIDAYHEYTSIDSGKITAKISKINAVSVVQSVVNELESTAKQKSAKLVFNTKKIPLLLADETILKKIITLATKVALNNTKRGFVIIDIDLVKKDNQCTIKIQNTGHGFDAAFLNDILTPFNREGLNYIPGFNGTGMEYPLINRLALLMKGKVAIESAIEQGITFTLTLPATNIFETVHDKKATEQATPEKSTIPWKGLKVLVVEDDVMNRLLFSKILKSASTLVIAENGEKALEVVGDFFREDEVFDLVLMDINLPQPWDGVKLKDKIKELFMPYKSVPFIAQTAYAMQGDREEFLSKGFDEYISKPIMKNELIRVSAIALKQKATS